MPNQLEDDAAVKAATRGGTGAAAAASTAAAAQIIEFSNVPSSRLPGSILNVLPRLQLFIHEREPTNPYAWVGQNRSCLGTDKFLHKLINIKLI